MHKTDVRAAVIVCALHGAVRECTKCFQHSETNAFGSCVCMDVHTCAKFDVHAKYKKMMAASQ